MKRVLILGPSGTGKTTLSLKLEKLLNLSPLHLDALHFKSGWELREKSMVREEIKKFMNENNTWVMDGNWSHSLPLRLMKADTVIYLDYGVEVSREGVLQRNRDHNGKSRPDIPQCIERLDDEFWGYIENFEETTGKSLKERISKLDKGIDVYIFKSRKDCEVFFDKI